MGTRIQWLLGRSLRSVIHDDQTDEWVFDFGEGYVLQVASPWRLVRHDGVAVACRDHGQQFGLPAPIDATFATRQLIGSHIVEEAAAANGTADLTIDFGKGIRLEIFNDSSGFEAWVLNGPDGRAFVAQGGGRLIEWEANSPNSISRTEVFRVRKSTCRGPG